jgi:hypothetical protein
MTIIRFEKEDDKQQYLDWRKKYPYGFVLNINTFNSKSTTTKNVIHSARVCLSLDTPPNPNRDRPITPEHPKVCSTDFSELEAEMNAKGLPYKPCGHCMKGKVKLRTFK